MLIEMPAEDEGVNEQPVAVPVFEKSAESKPVIDSLKTAETLNDARPNVVAVVDNETVGTAVSNSTVFDVTAEVGPRLPNASGTELAPNRKATVPSLVQVTDTVWVVPEPAGVGAPQPVAVPTTVMSPAPMVADSSNEIVKVAVRAAIGVDSGVHVAVGPAVSIWIVDVTSAVVGPVPDVPVTALGAIRMIAVPSVEQVRVTVYEEPEPDTESVHVAVPRLLMSSAAKPVTDWLKTTPYERVRFDVGFGGADVIIGVGFAVVIVTALDEVNVAGPLLPALSATVFGDIVRVTVPACVHRVVTSTAVPEVTDVVMLQGVAVPAAEKSDEAIPLTVSLKATEKTGLSVPTVEPGAVIVAVGAVVSRVVMVEVSSMEVEFPA